MMNYLCIPDKCEVKFAYGKFSIKKVCRSVTKVMDRQSRW